MTGPLEFQALLTNIYRGNAVWMLLDRPDICEELLALLDGATPAPEVEAMIRNCHAINQAAAQGVEVTMEAIDPGGVTVWTNATPPPSR